MRRVLVPLHVPDIAPLVQRAAQVVSLAGETMGTTWSVKFVEPAHLLEYDIHRLIEDRLALIIAQMSQWEPNSDLSRFNRAAAGTWHVLPDEFFQVLSYALALARDTGGAYDPTIGALTELWGFGAAGRCSTIPGHVAVEAARSRAGWTRLAIDLERKAVLQPGGVQLDLSSIAKGFAVDFVSDALTRRGLTDHLVEIGGELRGSGTKPDLSPWWVTIEETSDPVIALHELSIATSGDARRYIEHDGQKLSHTLDPRTGYPIDPALASVTVLESTCMKADAFATALSVLGPEEGHHFASERRIAARFVMRDAHPPQERMTPAFIAMLN